jgi:glycosyltransferase involved in cell wall biosynthesis
MKTDLPTISIVIPTLDSSSTLPACLESIREQDYPGDMLEIIIADAGSFDSTVEIASQFTDKIYPNPLKTGEAGKAVGVRHATGEIIALIDSDNILPGRDWLKRMAAPFADPEIAGTEPLWQEDGVIMLLCADRGE